MTGLTEGADYYIRVIAVNDAGPGAPGVTEPVTVKEPQGKDSIIFRQRTTRRELTLLYLELVLALRKDRYSVAFMTALKNKLKSSSAHAFQLRESFCVM